MPAIEIRGTMQAASEIDAFAGRLVGATREGLFAVAHGHNAFMVEGWLSGSPLKRRSGQLAGNWTIVEAPSQAPNELRVVEGTDTPYAKAQNYGFHGPVWVRQHLRRRGKKRRERKGRSQQKQLLQRSEVRARRENQQRREKDAMAAHGMTLRQLARDMLQARRRRGIQGGIAETVSPDLARDAAQSGAIAVRAHGRFMKLRGHRFVERSLAAYEPRAIRLMEAVVQRAIGRANG